MVAVPRSTRLVIRSPFHVSGILQDACQALCLGRNLCRYSITGQLSDIVILYNLTTSEPIHPSIHPTRRCSQHSTSSRKPIHSSPIKAQFHNTHQVQSSIRSAHTRRNKKKNNSISSSEPQRIEWRCVRYNPIQSNPS